MGTAVTAATVAFSAVEEMAVTAETLLVVTAASLWALERALPLLTEVLLRAATVGREALVASLVVEEVAAMAGAQQEVTAALLLGVIAAPTAATPMGGAVVMVAMAIRL